MGRMFRIITEGFEQPNGHGPAVQLITEKAPPAWPEMDEVPFIEVGGPEGPVVSSQLKKDTLKAKPRPIVVDNAKPAAAPAPLPAPATVKTDSRYMSVSFQHMPAPAPLNGVSTDIVAFHRPEHAVSAEYKALSNEIKDQLRVVGPKAVLLTSATGNAGTTTVALNLAATFAREVDVRVLVVDAAMGEGNAAKKLASAQSPGLAEVVTQKVPLAWSVQHTPIPRLHLLAGGEGHNASTETGKLINQLKQWFDWIIIDGGTWGVRADRDHLAAACDAIYAVARLTHVENKEFHTLRAALPATANLKGYVTTRV